MWLGAEGDRGCRPRPHQWILTIPAAKAKSPNRKPIARLNNRSSRSMIHHRPAALSSFCYADAPEHAHGSRTRGAYRLRGGHRDVHVDPGSELDPFAADVRIAAPGNLDVVENRVPFVDLFKGRVPRTGKVVLFPRIGFALPELLDAAVRLGGFEPARDDDALSVLKVEVTRACGRAAAGFVYDGEVAARQGHDQTAHRDR